MSPHRLFGTGRPQLPDSMLELQGPAKKLQGEVCLDDHVGQKIFNIELGGAEGVRGTLQQFSSKPATTKIIP